MALNITNIEETKGPPRAPVAVPRVNMNGTSKPILRAQYMAVYLASVELLSALDRAFPHGRDYQTYDDDKVLTAAIKQHGDRRAAVLRVCAEMQAIIVSLDGLDRGERK